MGLHVFRQAIIGIAGGIGAGKSAVAQMFSDFGCMVISSDEIVRQAYKDSMIKQQLRKWWGHMVFSPDGEIDRSAVARKVFSKPEERKRLEGLLHPYANQTRERLMHARRRTRRSPRSYGIHRCCSKPA